MNSENLPTPSRPLPYKPRRIPLLLRWGRVLELCAERGISTYAVRQAVATGAIPKHIPPQPFPGTASSRAYYLRDEVLAFCSEFFVGEAK
jgi:hypothetical protein